MLYRKPLTPHPVPAPSALLPNTEHDCGCASCSGAKSHASLVLVLLILLLVCVLHKTPAGHS
eukprot:7505683-Ditylum_brightwellii.AAC.1